jgi:hypothetical protein
METNGWRKRERERERERMRECALSRALFNVYLYMMTYVMYVDLHGGVSVPRHRYVNKATKMADHRRH